MVMSDSAFRSSVLEDNEYRLTMIGSHAEFMAICKDLIAQAKCIR